MWLPQQISAFCIVFVSASFVFRDKVVTEASPTPDDDDKQPPLNVLFILADDLGYNDVSWHNADIISPNLEKLARSGVILENHYVQPICTPTRAALMTGYYPFHTGRQHSYIHAQEPVGLHVNFTIMPQFFKDLGYKTHAIGKWHLGFCHEAYLPTKRGFDTFYGFYNGDEFYFDHTRTPSRTHGGGPTGYDFRDQDDYVDKDAKGIYSAELFGSRADKIIREHHAAAANGSSSHQQQQPFFMYLPFQSVHSPLQVPPKYLDMYPHIRNNVRRHLSGMVTAMDDAVGVIIKALEDTNQLENTVIVFSADNGGETFAGGNNWPLRGNKRTLWEGGTKAASFFKHPNLRQQGWISHKLMHVTDWLPTLLSSVAPSLDQRGKEILSQQLRSPAVNGMDGVDQWSSLEDESAPQQRTEFVYNIDPFPLKNSKFECQIGTNGNTAGVRMGDMKLLVGYPGSPDGWIPPAQVGNSLDDKIGAASPFGRCHDFDAGSTSGTQIRLFNITADPLEKVELSRDHPEIVSIMMEKLDSYARTMVPVHDAEEILAGNPNVSGNGTWGPGWCIPT